MNIINQNNEKNKIYLHHELHIRENVVMQLKLIEIEIQLVMYVENTIYL